MFYKDLNFSGSYNNPWGFNPKDGVKGKKRSERMGFGDLSLKERFA
jgi:hypothetical protein